MLQNRQTVKIDSRELQKLIDSTQHATEYRNAKNVMTSTVYYPLSV